jgi:outer membrane protein OmpA-like peptidoglycan-associated protein
MRSSQRCGMFVALALAMLMSGCTWMSGLTDMFKRQERSAEVNDPGADVTFGIQRDSKGNVVPRNPPSTAQTPGGATGPGTGAVAGATPGTDAAGAGGPAGSTAADAGKSGGAVVTPVPPDNVPAPTAGSGAGAPPVPPKAEGTPAGKELAMGEDNAGAAAGAMKGKVIDKAALSGDALFDFGKSDESGMSQVGRQKLDEVAARIKAMDPAAVGGIEVIGHADRLGSRAGNQRLSAQRAATVANYLVSKGIESSLIKSVGKGDTQPIAQCPGKKPTPKLIACLEPNRRVEVVIHGKQ